MILILKQAWHWHDKRFVLWRAIWRANEGRNHDSVRGGACMGMRVVRASSVARISKCSHHGTHWHALSLNSCAYFAHCLRTVHEVVRKWHDNFVMTPWFFNISKLSPRHGTHYFTRSPSKRVSTHIVNETQSVIVETTPCQSWRVLRHSV